MWVIEKSLRQLTLALALPAFFRDSQFVNLHSYFECWSFITTKGTWNFSEGSSHSDLKRQQKSAVQLVLQHCCKTSWKAMLRGLLPRFKPLSQQIRLLQVAWILTSDWINYTGVTQYKEVTSLTAKGATSLFNPFCSSVAKQDACSCYPFHCTIIHRKCMENHWDWHNYLVFCDYCIYNNTFCC